MYGKQLTVALLVLMADPGPLQNLQACVRRAHLNVLDIVHGPFAAGLSTLVEDEMKMGAACIDMGAGTTGISVFAQGSLVHAETIPLGGAQVTEEIARSLLTPFDQAERLKTFNGAAIVDAADERHEIEVQQVGEAGRDSFSRQPRSSLTSVMQKELELLFATVAKRLDASGFSGVAGKRVVLTGGVAGCEGVRDLASKVLGRRVRIGKPQLVGGLPQAAQAPGFASLVGLLLYCTRTEFTDMKPSESDGQEETIKQGTFGRMTRWLRDNF
jgi:cell division protein FtsA